MRLFDIVQFLRRRRALVTAMELAAEFGVSTRTIYRDIAALIARGAPIEGEAGLGYILGDGLFLPPLSFIDDEIDAVLLGLRWVEKRGDPQLAKAATDALAKITAVLPARAREAALTPAVFVGPDKIIPPATVGIGVLRDAIRDSRILDIEYVDKDEKSSRRKIWPIGLAFLEDARLIIAWCELRNAFRHFRLDRLVSAVAYGPYPGRRAVLLRRWSEQIEGEDVVSADISCQHDALSTSERGDAHVLPAKKATDAHGGGEPARP